MIFQENIGISTLGRGTTDVSDQLRQLVGASGIRTGICHVFIHHTSASLMICENADPSVRRDLERFMARTAPDGHPEYEHDAEGPDDMPAHIRAMLTGSDLTLPVTDGRLALGTWQGVYLWEHRHRPHRRKLTITVLGDG
ncbi:MAG: secondary thiamine-phosphate synthase [Gammaproteobacteria bacterium SG8_31]|jgi:secondary thiamine-phosphate synthase enzyme|nr:MAG: secondary thiamine-phosphate synthase [Gammaproteobacteria bacterium SG8_31]